ncbi:hypothetical protein [Pseudoalteromonas phage PH357]|nr:hypothetical protein [Pseudoalteromonas phage PH357]
MNLNNIVLVTMFGEGYYSGNVEEYSAIIPLEMFEEFEDEIISYTPYFYELDGKHSEVRGKVFIKKGEDLSFQHLISEMVDTDYDYVLERLFDELGVVSEDIYDMNKDFTENCEVKTETKYYYKGEEV